MSIEWASSYEAPTGLDAQRVIGTHGRRATLWSVAAVIGIIPVLVCIIALFMWDLIAPFGLPVEIPRYGAEFLGGPTGIWLIVCRTFGSDWGGRPFEYWLSAWWHSFRLPETLQGESLQKHHVTVSVDAHRIIDQYGNPSAVLEVSTINLRMADAETLGAHIQRWHNFLVGLRWPIQIVVRAWLDDEGTVIRRWFIALSADTRDLLDGRISQITKSLRRAGLESNELNGALFDSLQACWSIKPGINLGPSQIKRERFKVLVDGEWVRGHLLRASPRVFDVNWLAGLLDGDNPVDFSMWLDPVDNAEEIERLSNMITEWEASQFLKVKDSGFRDPDTDDNIRDAKITRAALRKAGMLRVFLTTIGFAVRAKDETTLRDREALLVDQLREQCGPAPTIPLDYRQDRAPLIGVPLGFPAAQLPMRIVSQALARTHPFSNSSLNMSGGIRCGTSKDSRRENKLNVWRLTNPHIMIPATTGSGKGYWVKVYIWRLLNMYPDVRVWIIQAEKDEYSALAEAMPCWSPPNWTDHPAIYSVEQPDPVLLMDPVYVQPGPVPRGKVLRVANLQTIDSVLFERPAAWEKVRLAGSQLTVYDLTQLPQQDKGDAIARIIEVLDQDASHETKSTIGHILIDELGIIKRSPVAMWAIDTAWRRFRSIPHLANPKEVSRRAMIGITQRPSDLLSDVNGPGKLILDLSATRVYFREEDTELAATAKNLRLTPDEISYLISAGEGDGMIVAGYSRVAFHLDATEEEHEIART